MYKKSEHKKEQNILKKHVKNVNAYIVHETIFVLFISIYLSSNIDMYIYIYINIYILLNHIFTAYIFLKNACIYIYISY
jgi:hypothetical protein